jgi:hypothetical protein
MGVQSFKVLVKYIRHEAFGRQDPAPLYGAGLHPRAGSPTLYGYRLS